MEGNRLEQFLASVSLWKSLHLTHTHTHTCNRNKLVCCHAQTHRTNTRADGYWLFCPPLDKMLRPVWDEPWCYQDVRRQRTPNVQTHTGLWAHRTATSLAPSLPRSPKHTHTQSLSIYFNWNLSLLCATLTQTEKPSGSSTAWDQISKPSGLMLINPTLLTRSLCQLICLILRYHPDCFTYVIQVPLKPCWGSKSPWNKASAGGKTPSGALITSTCRHNCAYQTPPS